MRALITPITKLTLDKDDYVRRAAERSRNKNLVKNSKNS
jgi:hypothetical protein